MADADAAREQAREILSERRFQDPDLPRPFETPLDWLGDRLSEAADWFARRFDDVDGLLPGGDVVVWVLLVGLAVALGFVAARTVVGRRAASGVESARTAGIEEEDPRLLEREADAASQRGDFALAVRLRFRAGVLRLGAEASTTGEIAARLDSPDFERVGATHEAIAYGGAPATAADAEAARAGWEATLP